MINPALTLAALADAALPDARPTRVEHVTEHPGDHYSLAFIEDNTQRRWAIRLPTDPVAAALQDQSLPLLETLRHHLPYATPHPHGFASLRDGRRAMLYPLIPGRTIKFDLLPPGPGLATALGQAIATIHNLNPTLYDTAGLPTYDATDLRRRRICDIDLGASTGLVPTGLLNRWEPLLEDIALWRFPTRPTHGHLEADHILIDFNDPHDASTGHIVAITSWDNATIGDPATDLATVLTHTNRRAAEAIFTAYTTTLTEPPDPAIRRRATLLNELRLLGKLLTAKRLNNHHALTHVTQALTHLNEQVGNQPIPHEPFNPTPTPATPHTPITDLYSAGTPTTDITFHTENTPTPSAEERARTTKPTHHRTTQRHPKNTTRPGGGTQSAANRSHNTLTNTTP